MTLVAPAGPHPRMPVDRGTLALLALAGLREGDRLLVLGSGNDLAEIGRAHV